MKRLKSRRRMAVETPVSVFGMPREERLALTGSAYYPGGSHRKPRWKFLVLATDEDGCGTPDEAEQVMDRLGLWSATGGGKPPAAVLGKWYIEYLESRGEEGAEEIPQAIRNSVLRQFRAYERTHLRRAIVSAADAFQFVTNKLTDGDLSTSVQIKYTADALGFLSRVARESGIQNPQAPIQIGQLRIDAGPRPRKHAKNTVTDAEFKVLDAGT